MHIHMRDWLTGPMCATGRVRARGRPGSEPRARWHTAMGTRQPSVGRQCCASARSVRVRASERERAQLGASAAMEKRTRDIDVVESAVESSWLRACGVVESATQSSSRSRAVEERVPVAMTGDSTLKPKNSGTTASR